MPRYSRKILDLHEEVYLNMDLPRGYEILNSLQKQIDIMFGKAFMSFYLLLTVRIDESLSLLEEIQEMNEEVGDDLIRGVRLAILSMYYLGFNAPPVDINRGYDLFDEAEAVYNQIEFVDIEEKNLMMVFYLQMKVRKLTKEFKLKEQLVLELETVENVSQVPVIGKEWSGVFVMEVAYVNLQMGDFDRAETLLKEAYRLVKSRPVAYWILNLWTRLYINLGNLEEAKRLNDKAIETSKKLPDTEPLFQSYLVKSVILVLNGEYDEAIDVYSQLLTLFGDFPNQRQITLFHLVKVHLEKFKQSQNREFLQVARRFVEDMEKISNTLPENKIIELFATYAAAKCNRYGNLVKKAQAMNDLLELYEEHPDNFDIVLDLLDLLFEDVLISNDPDTIDLIDTLMERLNSIPLRNNPNAIPGYISQKVILARYYFYLKGDAESAFDTLQDALTILQPLKFDSLTQQVASELKKFEDEVLKWEGLDSSVQSRLKRSNFSRYIEAALKEARNYT